MAQMSEFIQRAKFYFESQGAEKVKADLEGARQGQDNLNRSTEHGERTTRAYSQSVTRAEGSLISKARAVDKVFRAQMDLQKVEKQVQVIMDKGGELTSVHIKLLETLKNNLEKVTQAENDNIKATDGMIAALTKFQKGEFTAKLDAWTASVNKATAAAKEAAVVISRDLGKIMGGNDPLNVGKRMSDAGKEAKAKADADKAAAEAAKIAGMTGAMSKFGGKSDFAATLDAWSKNDPIRKATIETTRLTTAMEANAVASKTMAAGMDAAGKKAAENALFIQKMSAATGAGGAKSKSLTMQEKLVTQQTAGDVIASLATGASPMTILLQQGEQFLQPFGTGLEGIKNAASKLGPILLRLVLNPITLIGAAVGTTAYAMYRWTSQVETLTVALNGLGRQSGLTVSQVSDMAAQAAARGGVSAATGRGLAGQFLQAGVPRQALGGAIEATQSFSRRLGLPMEEAAKTLADALADPARGADDLAKKYGMVSFAQREQIKQLAAMNDQAGASAKLLDMVTQALADMEDPTWRLTRAYEAAKNSISNSIVAWGDLLSDPISYISGTKTPEQIAREETEKRKADQRAADAQTSRDSARNKDLGFLRQNSNLAVAEIQARTYAEREAVAMQRAYTQALQATDDKVKANIAAEGERAKMLAEATRKVEDMTRSSADNARLARMSPYERGKEEIRIKYRDFERENLPNLAKPIVNAFDYAGKGATALGDALTAVAGRIGRLIPMSEWSKESSAPPTARASSTLPFFASATMPSLASAREAIAAIESRGSGGYSAVGPATKTGDRAYGRYQVMGSNVGPWTQQTLGQRMTPSEFVKNPAAQDAVFNRQFGLLVQKFGNFSDAASAWFTGRPLAKGANAKDVTGTTGAAYVAKFNALAANPARAALAAASASAVPEGAVTPDTLRKQSAANIQRDIDTYDFEKYSAALQQVNQDIDNQRELVDRQAESFGLSTEQVAYAAKEQELLNQFQAQGVTITDELRQMIASTAYNYAELAKRTEEAQRKTEDFRFALDTVRSTAKDIGAGLVEAFRRGESAIDAMRGVLDRLISRLVDKTLDSAIEGLLGKMGSLSTGSTGGPLGSVFGGGNTGGSAGGGFFSSILGGIGKLFGFANGGIMTGVGPQPLAAFANGGVMTSTGPLPMHAYATGGIADRPQLAMFGEGRKPEAYVPLEDGRSIQVKMRKSGAKSEFFAPLPNGRGIPVKMDQRLFPASEDSGIRGGISRRIKGPQITQDNTPVRRRTVETSKFADGGVMTGAGPQPIAAFANGGVMTGAGALPLRTYATGGVANTPQLALFGEGRKPEAFVPLPDGRTIPVTMQGQQNSGNGKVTINNYAAGVEVETKRMSDGELLVIVNKMVDQKMKAQVPGIVANSQRRAM